MMAPADELAVIFRNRARVDMAQALQASIFATGRALDDMVGIVASTFGAVQRLESARFTSAHQQVGEAAIRSISAAYRNRRFRRGAGRYREGDNRLSGKLGKALSNSKAMVSADASSVSIINTSFLDREAAHWRRLNFGAGAGGAEGITAPARYAITWEGVAAGTLGLEAQPSPAFFIPRGYWMEGGRMVSPGEGRRGQFFPGNPSNRLGGATPGSLGVGMQAKKMTRGIASRNFLDAGVRRLANELPRAYAAIYADLYENARGTLENAARRAGVATTVNRRGRYVTTLPRPSAQNISYHHR